MADKTPLQVGIRALKQHITINRPDYTIYLRQIAYKMAINGLYGENAPPLINQDAG